MKRGILAAILIVAAVYGASGQNSGPIDLILLLDTSSTMSSSYDEVNGYMTGGFLREFLRIGDTFHLIPFSERPKVDISRRIEGSGDVETIIGRMLLQYPLERWSDISAALSFAESYAATLPSRPKKIVLISDGLTAPGPDRNALAETELNSLISGTRTRLNPSGASLDYVKVIPGQPLANLPQSGRAPVSASSSAQPGTQTQTVTQAPAGQPQTQPGPTAQPGTTTQPGPATQPSPATQPGTTTQPGPATQPGSTAQPGTTTQPGPATQPGTTGQRPADTETGLPVPLIIGIVVAALVLALIIFLVARRPRSSPPPKAPVPLVKEEEEEKKTPRLADHSKDLANFAASLTKQRTTPYPENKPAKSQLPFVTISFKDPLILNLFVEDQSTAIGKRNIHNLKSGYNLTIGGGRSDFLVFLVPVPSAIGEIRRDGNRLTFYPRKPKYFPDLGSRELPDCLGKSIRIVSDKNYEMRIKFEQYEDPLEKLNRLLNSLKVPG